MWSTTPEPNADVTAEYIRTRDMPLEHADAFEDLLERTVAYEAEHEIPPLRRPEYREHARRFITAQFAQPPDRADNDRKPVAIWLYDGTHDTILPLAADDTAGRAIATILADHAKRSCMVIWPNGKAADFRLLLDLYLPQLLDMGFHVEVAAGTNQVRWLRISKDKHAWWWCDFAAVTGYDCLDWRQLWPSSRGEVPGPELTPYTAYYCVARLQRMLEQDYGVCLRPTLAGASIACLARQMPKDLWVWKPPALLVAMCRIGLGYRGGYVYAERYKGPARKWDINRLYTWCLTQPLPARVAIGRGSYSTTASPGIYVCSVSGRGKMPAYLSVWHSRSRTWHKRYFHIGKVTSVLCSAEIAGIRRLGYSVEVGYGYRFTQTFNLKSYARHLEAALTEHGRGSAEAKLARMLANMAYGKLGQNAEHDEAMFALEKPGADWAPMLEGDGAEIPNLWQRKTTAYYAAQHVDIAATITAHGRRRLYLGFRAVNDAGGRVVYSDTDSIIATPCQPDRLPVSDSAIGAYREESATAEAIVLGRKKYAYGGEARLSGYRDGSAEKAALVRQLA